MTALKWLLTILKPWQKTFIAFALDGTLALLAFPLAFLLRYGQAFPDVIATHGVLEQTGLIIAGQLLCFYFLGLYRGIWRYASTADFIRLLKGITLAVSTSFLLLFLFNRLQTTPRSIFLINWMLLCSFLGGWRLLYRVLRDYSIYNASKKGDERNILIIGAGSGGEQLLREIRKTPSLNYNVVGFIDDDPGKINKLLHSVPVKGKVSDLEKVAMATEANMAFIAIPTASGKDMKRIVAACQNANLEFKTLPPIEQILNQKVSLRQLREVAPEDLLGRQQVHLEKDAIDQMVFNKSVLVTGAGGSIGSEICKQLAEFNPKRLILFESSEYNLYQIDLALKEQFPHIDTKPVLGDIRCLEDIEKVFSEEKPELVFHSAAYKHVPLVEHNPKPAIRTNIFGTRLVAFLTIKYGAERFVLISTDKAVNPTNIMGATKRIGEMICKDLEKSSQSTKFAVVRFGNVLGSSGSVIPRFKNQIEAGGPVTVTHPEINRFFMSISEASQLVLQAGAISEGGEVFVLDMGEPVKIVDLARELIKLSGLEPEVDIQITYTGLRPGEKLFEEVLFDDENTLPSSHPMLRTAMTRSNRPSFATEIEELEQNLDNISRENIIERLSKLVAEYAPSTGALKSDNSTANQIH